jgi:hypothetical protein
VSENRYRRSPRISRRVSVSLVIVYNTIAEDSIDGVPTGRLCGTASSVSFVADDGDAGGASWEYCEACAAGDVGEDDFGGGFCGDGGVGVADFDDDGWEGC